MKARMVFAAIASAALMFGSASDAAPDQLAAGQVQTRGAYVQADIPSATGAPGSAILVFATRMEREASLTPGGRPEPIQHDENVVEMDVVYNGESLAAETPPEGLGPFPNDPQMNGGTFTLKGVVTESSLRTCAGQQVNVTINLAGVGQPMPHPPAAVPGIPDPKDPPDASDPAGAHAGLRLYRALRVQGGTIDSCLGRASFGGGDGSFYNITKGSASGQITPPALPRLPLAPPGAPNEGVSVHKLLPDAPSLDVSGVDLRSLLTGLSEAPFSPSYEGTGPRSPGRPQGLITPIQRSLSGDEMIFGTDSRVQTGDTTLFPFRAILKTTGTWQNTNQTFGCTAWMIGPSIAVTAGHCVYSYDLQKWASGVQVWPGRQGASTPFGSCWASYAVAWNDWMDDEDYDDDIGLLKLNCTVGNTVGWFGFFSQSADLEGTPTMIRGYPGDKPFGTQWRSTGSVDDDDDQQINYFNDTTGGMSGSPVYYNRPNCGKCSMAAHSGAEQDVWGDWYNRGTGIDSQKFWWLLSWKWVT